MPLSLLFRIRMAGDDTSAPARTSDSGPLGGEVPGDTRQALGVRATRRDTTPDAVLAAIAEDLHGHEGASVQLSRDVLTPSLAELLLALVALRADGTHGTGLMDDIAGLFDVEPSPGTVYPRLHDLESESLLERYDLVETKQYAVSDEDAAAARIERAASQHLAMGLFLRAALEEL